jgi:hypothetical protein
MPVIHFYSNILKISKEPIGNPCGLSLIKSKLTETSLWRALSVPRREFLFH